MPQPSDLVNPIPNQNKGVMEMGPISVQPMRAPAAAGGGLAGMELLDGLSAPAPAPSASPAPAPQGLVGLELLDGLGPISVDPMAAQGQMPELKSVADMLHLAGIRKIGDGKFEIEEKPGRWRKASDRMNQVIAGMEQIQAMPPLFGSPPEGTGSNAVAQMAGGVGGAMTAARIVSAANPYARVASMVGAAAGATTAQDLLDKFRSMVKWASNQKDAESQAHAQSALHVFAANMLGELGGHLVGKFAGRIAARGTDKVAEQKLITASGSEATANVKAAESQGIQLRPDQAFDGLPGQATLAEEAKRLAAFSPAQFEANMAQQHNQIAANLDSLSKSIAGQAEVPIINMRDKVEHLHQGFNEVIGIHRSYLNEVAREMRIVDPEPIIAKFNGLIKERLGHVDGIVDATSGEVNPDAVIRWASRNSSGSEGISAFAMSYRDLLNATRPNRVHGVMTENHGMPTWTEELGKNYSEAYPTPETQLGMSLETRNRSSMGIPEQSPAATHVQDPFRHSGAPATYGVDARNVRPGEYPLPPGGSQGDLVFDTLQLSPEKGPGVIGREVRTDVGTQQPLPMQNVTTTVDQILGPTAKNASHRQEGLPGGSFKQPSGPDSLLPPNPAGGVNRNYTFAQLASFVDSLQALSKMGAPDAQRDAFHKMLGEVAREARILEDETIADLLIKQADKNPNEISRRKLTGRAAEIIAFKQRYAENIDKINDFRQKFRHDPQTYANFVLNRNNREQARDLLSLLGEEEKKQFRGALLNEMVADSMQKDMASGRVTELGAAKMAKRLNSADPQILQDAFGDALPKIKEAVSLAERIERTNFAIAANQKVPPMLNRFLRVMDIGLSKVGLPLASTFYLALTTKNRTAQEYVQLHIDKLVRQQEIELGLIEKSAAKRQAIAEGIQSQAGRMVIRGGASYVGGAMTPPPSAPIGMPSSLPDLGADESFPKSIGELPQ